MAEKKTDWFKVRASKGEVDLLMGAAQLEGVTVAEWFRRRLAEAVERAGGPSRIPVVERKKRERLPLVTERVGSALRSTGIEAAGNDEPWLDKEPDWGV